ncbi:exodeoxyribonuclease 7 large subunit [Powai lake megavirus]|uniref:Exodeoxyribonuclease 7 large subunit n=1 Tax=Powai lake megavirus TaxID=1842663 RepID=A0A167RNX3_9VIRU|nr:exodeoxyribonuclease 7 large subunit [Powai lake megavirus]ANB50937.1 exodeoxyribonuclease 7 large subunit [Powai lake megavirus]
MSDIDIDDIDFQSDTESEINDMETKHIISSKNNTISISDIIKTINNSIISNPRIHVVKLIVDVTHVSEHKNMAFIKIRDATGIISAVIYASTYTSLLKTGDKINITGRLTIYNSQIQLIILTYVKIGFDDINQFEILKKKLEKLGYLDNKPIINNNYNKIGIISSINAAGMRDFLHTITQRCRGKQIYLYPATVQGQNAVNEIIQAINLANQHNAVDIIVLIRGGGSKEDLACFNDEKMAISIHNSIIPIVTGIGHQIDTSIADLVCAKSFITPTAVAQNITIENMDSNNKIKELLSKISHNISNFMNSKHEYLVFCEEKISRRRNLILDHLDNIMVNHVDNLKNTKINIFTKTSNLFQYISETENNMHNLISSHINYLDNHISISHNKIIQSIATYKQSLEMLRVKYDEISKPGIIDHTGKEITTLSQFKSLKSCRICFLDGTYDLKFD